MSKLPLTREERGRDVSGTPHGLIGLADDQDDLLLLESLPQSLEHNVLVEFPVGPEFTRYRDYRRFVQFRRSVAWVDPSPGGDLGDELAQVDRDHPGACSYALIKEAKGA